MRWAGDLAIPSPIQEKILTDDMLRADPRLRRQTLLALALAAILP
jgi:hypothetical protein